MDMLAMNITVNMVVQYFSLKILMEELFHIVILQAIRHQNMVVQHIRNPHVLILSLLVASLLKIMPMTKVEQYILILKIMLLMVVFLIPIPLMMTVEPFMLKQDTIQ